MPRPEGFGRVRTAVDAVAESLGPSPFSLDSKEWLLSRSKATHWAGQMAREAEMSMSAPANVEIVQGIYAAFARRDIPAIVAMLSPEVEWGEPSNPFNPAGGTRRGHAGFLEWIEIGRRSEEILVLEPRKILVDEDSVAVVGFMRCRAISTGKEYESDFVHVVTLEAGKVTRFLEFFDTYAAGEAFR